MKKYRIFKIIFNFNQQQIPKYEVQEKILWWWKPLEFLVVYSTDLNYDYFGPFEVAYLSNRTLLFDSEAEARKHLDHYRNLCIEVYKGEKINKLINLKNGNDIYVNMSYPGRVYSRIGYEYSNHYNDLKGKIDQRNPDKNNKL